MNSKVNYLKVLDILKRLTSHTEILRHRHASTTPASTQAVANLLVYSSSFILILFPTFLPSRL